MASARNEAPRESSVGRGVPFPLEEGLGGGYAPFPDFFFDFWAQNGKFWCILGANFIAVEQYGLHA